MPADPRRPDACARSRGAQSQQGDVLRNRRAGGGSHGVLEDAGACDGFHDLVPALPSTLQDLSTKWFPELERRGLFPHRLHRPTLRDHLGFAPPGEPLRIARFGAGRKRAEYAARRRAGRDGAQEIDLAVARDGFVRVSASSGSIPLVALSRRLVPGSLPDRPTAQILSLSLLDKNTGALLSRRSSGSSTAALTSLSVDDVSVGSLDHGPLRRLVTRCYWLCGKPPRQQRIAACFILLPFWTSALIKNFPGWCCSEGTASSADDGSSPSGGTRSCSTARPWCSR